MLTFLLEIALLFWSLYAGRLIKDQELRYKPSTGLMATLGLTVLGLTGFMWYQLNKTIPAEEYPAGCAALMALVGFWVGAGLRAIDYPSIIDLRRLADRCAHRLWEQSDSRSGEAEWDDNFEAYCTALEAKTDFRKEKCRCPQVLVRDYLKTIFPHIALHKIESTMREESLRPIPMVELRKHESLPKLTRADLVDPSKTTPNCFSSPLS